mmetsp:Transcript_4299/g.11115  ORF Transcript_4299/g.11115 Transcript_4299/m.11115 type:complete len:269 (-) Transcript_4299:164-970(-)
MKSLNSAKSTALPWARNASFEDPSKPPPFEKGPLPSLILRSMAFTSPFRRFLKPICLKPLARSRAPMKPLSSGSSSRNVDRSSRSRVIANRANSRKVISIGALAGGDAGDAEEEEEDCDCEEVGVEVDAGAGEDCDCDGFRPMFFFSCCSPVAVLVDVKGDLPVTWRMKCWTDSSLAGSSSFLRAYFISASLMVPLRSRSRSLNRRRSAAIPYDPSLSSMSKSNSSAPLVADVTALAFPIFLSAISFEMEPSIVATTALVPPLRLAPP